MDEALECLAQVRDLCPDCSFEEKVNEVLHEVFGKAYGCCEEAPCERGGVSPPVQSATPKDSARVWESVEEPCFVGLNVLARMVLGCDLVFENACCSARIIRVCGVDEPEGQEIAQQPGGSPAGCDAETWLSTPVTAEFVQTPLKGVLDQLRGCRPVPMIVDLPALEAQGVSLESPVSLVVMDVPVDAVLKTALGQLHLRHVVKDGVVFVTSEPGEVEHSCPAQAETEQPEYCPPCPRAEKMHAERFATARGEQEASPGRPDSPERCAVRCQVKGLMKACHLAFEEGRYDKAADLARQAHALDPRRVEADPLVYKLHLLGEECLKKGGCPGSNEDKIEGKLKQPVSLNFEDAPLKQVLADLREFTGINIVVDDPALAEEGIGMDSPVTIQVDRVSLKTALNLILKKVHLTYVIKDGVLQVTTKAQARGKPRTQVYEVDDLIEGAEGSEQLVRLLVATVEPRTWSEMGGPGTIDYCAAAGTLVISQTADVHEVVAQVLEALRSFRKATEAQQKDTPYPDGSQPLPHLCPMMPPMDEMPSEADELEPLGAAPGVAPRPAAECPVMKALAWLEEEADSFPEGSKLMLGVGPGGLRMQLDVPCLGCTWHLGYDYGAAAVWVGCE
jgi:hypothetical protein